MAQDEFLEDDIDDQKTVEYIKNTLPQELKEKYSDDTLYYILDVINDYFTTSGVLDQEPDADGCINIDNDALVEYIIKEAKRDKIGSFPADEIILIVEAEADYAAVSIGLLIQHTAGGKVVIDDIKNIIQSVISVLILKVLRQRILDVLNGLLIVKVILKELILCHNQSRALSLSL